jgi:hypothetical protein
MVDSEVAMARTAVRVGALLAVPTVALAWLLRGPAAGLTALGAVLFVTGLFWLNGHSLAWAGRRGPTVLQAVALGGFFLRLVTYAALIVLLRPIEAIDGHVLAISTAVTTIIVLAVEVRFVLRHGEFWFVQPTPIGAGAPGLATDGKDRA